MVNPPRPDLNWPEASSVDEDIRLAERIAGELGDRLAHSGPCSSVLFAALPHPRFFLPAVKEIAAEASAFPDFALIARYGRAPAFTARAAKTFARILPAVMRRGPPEVVLVALCLDDDAQAVNETLLTALQTGQDIPPGTHFVCACYDSGDLMDIT